MIKYFVNLREDGQKVKQGSTVHISDDYTHEVSQEVFENQDRAFYDAVTDTWTVYDQIAIAANSPVLTSETVTVTATLPAGTPDTEVTLNISYTDDEGVQTIDPVVVTVVDGVAAHDFSFTVAGTYTVTASSTHHGAASTEVIVNEPAA